MFKRTCVKKGSFYLILCLLLGAFYLPVDAQQVLPYQLTPKDGSAYPPVVAKKKSSAGSRRKERREEGEEHGFDRPDLAMEYEFRITRDPATGDVPRERLTIARNKQQQQRAMRTVAAAGLVSNATWIERGPSNVGGRTRALMFDPNDATKKKVWAGGVGGGLWYTNDITAANPFWSAVNDFWANIAVSCIAYAPASTQTLYVGTGEGWGNLDAIRGAGIWKSTDGGLTWTQLSATVNNSNFDYIHKIAVTSTGVVLAATSSHFCNRGGVFRSADGGATWTLVLGTQGSTCALSNAAAADLEIGSDGVIYASYGISSTGVASKSTDGGLTWTQMNNGTNGFPNTGLARIELCVAPSDPNRLYAMAQNSSTSALLNIYTSANQGSTWTTCTKPAWVDQTCASTSTDMTRTQAWYDLIIAVDPNTPTTLMVGGVDVMKSTNTGSSWTQISSWCTCCSRQYMHADQHAMAYQPGSSSVAIFGNDGGVFYTANANAATPTLTSKDNGYNVTQFYACAMHPTAGTNYFLAGAQDNGTQQFTTAGMNATTDVNGGDGAYCFIDQSTPSVQIASYVYNNYSKSTNNWATSTTLSSSSTTGDFINPADYDDVNHILYSSSSSTALQRILNVTGTPTTGTITISGMSAMAGNIRVSPYAPVGTSTIFVGTQNSKLYKVTNAQGTPVSTDISSTSWPASSTISCIEIGASESDLLVTFSNYGVASVWRTTDGGATWSNKEGDLPDMPVRWAMYNPSNRSEVFLATELGVWSTGDVTVASPTWVSNNNGLANVRVDMFQMRTSDNEVIAATHGRGLFSTSIFGGPPTANFSASTTSTCVGNTVTYTSTSSGGITSWSWNFGSGASPATSTSSGPVAVTYSTAGTKTVSLTVTGPGGSNTKTLTNYVSVAAAISAIGSISGPATTCIGNSGVTYSIPAVSGATSYTWSVPSTWSITSGQNSTSIQVSIGTGNGTVSVFASNGTCTTTTATLAVSASVGQQTPVITPSGSAVYCPGDFLQLTASANLSSCGATATATCNGTGATATLGAGTSSNTTSTYPTTYGNFYESSRQQFLFTAAELTTAGLKAGTITSVTFDIANINTSGVHRSYTIKLLCTAVTTMSAFQSGATTVFGPVTYTPVSGLNTHLFTTPFNWNGTSNLILEICHNNDTGTGVVDYTTNASAKYTTTAFVSCILRRLDNGGDQCPSTTVTATSSNRPNVVFNGCGGAANPTYVWSTGATTNPITVTAAGTYTVTATNAGGCSSSVSLVVAPKPPVSATIKLFVEGFYNGPSTMTPVLYNAGLSTDPTACDSVTVELHEATSPFATHQTMNALLRTNGTLTCAPACDIQGHAYYIVVRTRNGIETWSKNPVVFGATTSYRFDQ